MWYIQDDYEYLSPKFKASLGYAEDEMAHHPSAWQQIAFEEDLPHVFEAFEAHVANGAKEPFEVTVRYRHKAGHTVWILCRGKVIEWTEDGQPQLAVGTHVDVTALKKTEQELRESQKKLALSQHMAKIGYFQYDLLEDQYEWSDEMYRVHEIQPDEIVLNRATVTRFDRFYRGEQLEKMQRYAQFVKETGQALEGEVQMVTGTGTPKWVHTLVQPNRNAKGEVTGFFGTIQDIHQQKESELRLAHFLEGLRLLNRLASNSQQSFREQRQEALQLTAQYLGLEMGTLCRIEGEQYTVHQFFSTETTALYEGQTFELHATYCHLPWQHKELIAFHDIQQTSYTALEAYRQQQLVAYVGVPVPCRRGYFGTLLFASSHARSTAFTPQEQEFIQLLATFVGQTLDREEDEKALRAAKEKAEHSAKAKSEFLSTMSHELRTPLNAIIGTAHLLEQENPAPHQQKNISVLKFSSHNLLSLVNDILDFNKIEAGRIELEPMQFHLRDFMDSLVQAHQGKAHDKGIQLKMIMDECAPSCVVNDHNRLAQVLNNLLSNAIKFTEEGSVKMKVEVLHQKGDQYRMRFEVVDTGIGMQEAQLSRIFEDFVQADASTSRRFGGTGLGLSISRRLIRLMGGEIQVKTKEGRGSTFWFELDMEGRQHTTGKDPRHSCPKENPASESLLQEARILLAEDNSLNVYVAKKFLYAMGVYLQVAINGREALEWTQKGTFDLVLMDLEMPEMDGYEAAQAIKALQPDLPILAMTAHASKEVTGMVGKCGMDGYISKPIHPNTLKQEMLKALSTTL